MERFFHVSVRLDGEVTRPFRIKTVVSRATNESLRTNSLEWAW